jgi:Ceramidase
MSKRNRILLLAAVTLLCMLYAWMLQPIRQNPGYHLFADQRKVAGIANFFNVLSNLPFLLLGIYGLWVLLRSDAGSTIKKVYGVMFAGILLTSVGSAYYHYAPGNSTLVFDRIPMVLVFMAFLSATILGWIDARAGVRLLLPLLVLGVASVLWWHYTELKGAGDLRLYGFIQFYPMLIVPIIFMLFASPENNRGLRLLVWVILWYCAAKIFEQLDVPVYRLTGFISGHSLKHIAAAMATWYIVKFFQKKYLQQVVQV